MSDDAAGHGGADADADQHEAAEELAALAGADANRPGDQQPPGPQARPMEDDFSRALRRHVLARLAGWLRRRPGDADRLLSFDEVVAALGWRGEYDLGLQTIQLDTVVGTADSRREFDRRFRPTSGQVRERWERLDLAQRRGAAIPPIEVYRVGGLHFVKDGHHRVSVAVATGRKTIDAYVTEVTTQMPATGDLLLRSCKRTANNGCGLPRSSVDSEAVLPPG